MNIHINNEPETIDGDKISIAGLLALKKFTFKMIVVKVNDKIVMKEDYPATLVADGDNVLVLHLMSGG